MKVKKFEEITPAVASSFAREAGAPDVMWFEPDNIGMTWRNQTHLQVSVKEDGTLLYMLAVV